MKLCEAAEILEDHNKWRRSKNIGEKMIDPKLLGQAIDVIVENIGHFDPDNTGFCSVCNSETK